MTAMMLTAQAITAAVPGITPRRLAELAAELDRERRSLQAQIRAHQEAQVVLSVAQREEGGAGSAPGDVASDLAEEELVVALQRADMGRLVLVERALARLASGVYGLCERCGAPIGYPRLRALPWTATCRECAGKRP